MKKNNEKIDGNPRQSLGQRDAQTEGDETLSRERMTAG